MCRFGGPLLNLVVPRQPPVCVVLVKQPERTDIAGRQTVKLVGEEGHSVTGDQRRTESAGESQRRGAVGDALHINRPAGEKPRLGEIGLFAWLCIHARLGLRE